MNAPQSEQTDNGNFWSIAFWAIYKKKKKYLKLTPLFINMYANDCVCVVRVREIQIKKR